MLLLSIFLSTLSVIAFGKTVPETFLKDEPLNLTPLIENGEAAKARNMSAVDPTLFAGLKSHAAFINVNKTGKWNLFFWFFPAEGLPLESTPWIIWLQGGPGGSSLYGLFEEIGPLQYVDGKVQKMPITWASNYSVLFIDNPIDAGFSYVEDGGDDNIYNEDQVGGSLLNFTQQFLQVFPELRKAPLFITGESYAGKYIPAFGHYIHNKNDTLPINLKGLAIGDGWIDPPSLLHSADFILQLGLTDLNGAVAVDVFEREALKFWNEGKIEEYEEAYMRTLGEVMIRTDVDNVYNIITEDLPSENYREIFNQTNIRRALHVGNRIYHSIHLKQKSNGNHRVYLDDDIYMSVKPWLEELVEHYGVMCYTGQLDLLVGYAPSVHLYRSLKWSGQDNYLNAKRVPIKKPEGAENALNVIGYVKGYGNFMEVLVRAAGHMVPYDQPVAAKEIIDIFINKFK